MVFFFVWILFRFTYFIKWSGLNPKLGTLPSKSMIFLQVHIRIPCGVVQHYNSLKRTSRAFSQLLILWIFGTAFADFFFMNWWKKCCFTRNTFLNVLDELLWCGDSMLLKKVKLISKGLFPIHNWELPLNQKVRFTFCFSNLFIYFY